MGRFLGTERVVMARQGHSSGLDLAAGRESTIVAVG